MTVTLLLVGVFFVIMMNLNNVATSSKNDVEIRVHIDVAATEENQQSYSVSKLRRLPEVKTVFFSPKEKELRSI